MKQCPSVDRIWIASCRDNLMKEKGFTTLKSGDMANMKGNPGTGQFGKPREAAAGKARSTAGASSKL